MKLDHAVERVRQATVSLFLTCIVVTLAGIVATLAACMPEGVANDPALQACNVEEVADLPMADGRLLPIVPARLDGQPVSMLLDTGSGGLSVTPEAQGALRLGADHRFKTTVRGIGGSSDTYRAIIQRFELGGVELPQTSAFVAEMPNQPAVEPPLAGIVGGQMMSNYEMEFNFAGRRVGLWQSSGCTGAAPRWTGVWSTLRLTRSTANLLTMEVSVDGHILRALLGTGARITTIDDGAARRLGLPGASSLSARVIRGGDGSDIITHILPVSDVTVGSVHLGIRKVLVGPIRLPFADMILGVDSLQHRDIWLSYRTQKAFIR